jgi:hypothetical protein
MQTRDGIREPVTASLRQTMSSSLGAPEAAGVGSVEAGGVVSAQQGNETIRLMTATKEQRLTRIVWPLPKDLLCRYSAFKASEPPEDVRRYRRQSVRRECARATLHGCQVVPAIGLKLFPPSPGQADVRRNSRTRDGLRPANHVVVAGRNRCERRRVCRCRRRGVGPTRQSRQYPRDQSERAEPVAHLIPLSVERAHSQQAKSISPCRPPPAQPTATELVRPHRPPRRLKAAFRIAYTPAPGRCGRNCNPLRQAPEPLP